MASKTTTFRGKKYRLDSTVTNSISIAERKARELRKKGYSVHLKRYGKRGSVRTEIYKRKK